MVENDTVLHRTPPLPPSINFFNVSKLVVAFKQRCTSHHFDPWNRPITLKYKELVSHTGKKKKRKTATGVTCLVLKTTASFKKEN